MLNAEIKVLVEAPALVAALERFASILEKGQALDVMAGAEKEINQVKQKSAVQSESIEAAELEVVKEDISVVDLRAKAQEVGKTQEAKKAIKELLTKFKCKSISDIPAGKRTDFMKELENL